MENIFVEFLPPWVETGLQPAFYDKESGTVLQQTARMYARVNMLIRMFNKLSKQTKETVEEYINKFNELKEYVDDYFDNLDVQEEINNKLEQMAKSGELTHLISTYIDPLIAQINGRVTTFEEGVNTEISNFKTSVNNSITDINTEVQALTNGGPAGTYATVEALTNADPNHSKIYVVTADGKWYYYNSNNSTWTAGGEYLTNAQDTEDSINKLNILCFSNIQDRLKEFDGKINLDYTRGKYGFEDDPWSTETTNYHIRTAELLTVYDGDTIGLSDYTNLEYCYAVLKSDNTTAYHDWRHEDSKIDYTENEGVVGIVVRKRDLTKISDPNTIGRKMYIKRYSYYLKDNIEEALETPDTIIHNDFVNGTTYSGDVHYNPQRIVTYSKHSFDKDVVVTNDNPTFKMAIHWVNPDTSANMDSGWISNDNNSFIVKAGIKFRVMVARVTEVPGETADIDEFSAGIKVIEKTTDNVQTLYNPNTVRYGYLNASGGFDGGEAQVTLTTDFIKLNPDRTLSLDYKVDDDTKEAWIGIGFYDADKQWIKRVSQTGVAGSINHITRFSKFPTGTAYVRISFRHYTKSTMQLNYGYNFGEYTPYEIADTTARNAVLKYNLKSIAHRGWSWSGGAPENTIPAFVEAKKHGFNIVETDIQFSSDGVPVCIHDSTLDRTTNGTGRVIDKTIAQIKELVANAGKEGYPDVRIPTFEEFIQTCRDLELVAYIELKMNDILYEDYEKYETIMNIVKKYDMEDKVCWLANNYRRLLPIRALYPYARLMLMSFTTTAAAQTEVIELLHGLLDNGKNTLVYSADHRYINSDYINLCKSYNIPAEAWTLYNSYQMDMLDGYISGVTSEQTPYNIYLQEKYGI